MRIRGNSRLWIRNSLVVAISAWLLWSLFHKEFWSAWREVHGGWILFALLVTLTTLAVRALKWHLLLVAKDPPCARRESVRALLGGYALASVTPGRVGDLSRCMFVAEGRRGQTLLFTFVDKTFDLWAVLGYAALSLFLFVPHIYALAAAAAWLGLIPFFAASRRWARKPPSGASRLGRFRVFWKTLTGIPAGRFGSWALCAGALDLLTLFFLLRAFHPTTFNVALATYPWLVIAGALPLSIGGVGPREGLSVLLLPFFSISRTVAINVSLVFFGFTALLPALFGALWLLIHPPSFDPRMWKNLRNPFKPPRPVENREAHVAPQAEV